jgi:hypothetical protein
VFPLNTRQWRSLRSPVSLPFAAHERNKRLFGSGQPPLFVVTEAEKASLSIRVIHPRYPSAFPVIRVVRVVIRDHTPQECFTGNNARAWQ